ncbi:MAG: hypothetical protein KIH80_005860 [Flavobacteriia bacterium]|nr:hypothetical protein [Flavobacteriia bacterium]
MRVSLWVLFFSFFSCSFVQAQYASVELSSGGFSFVPAFTDENPNIIINAGTGSKGLFSAHMIGNIRMGSLNPRGFIFITRMKLIDKKLKLNIGTHLPAIQIDEDFQVDTFFAQEVTAAYPLSEKFSLSSLYIHGKGRNNDLEINLLAINGHYGFSNFSFVSQLYFLDLDQTYGVAETISYKLSNQFELKGFLNQTISSNDFRWTVGLNYHL